MLFSKYSFLTDKQKAILSDNFHISQPPLSGDLKDLMTFQKCTAITEIQQSYTDAFPARSFELLRKEVIQPHLPVRLPCYDFTPLTGHTFGASLSSVRTATSGASDSGGVTGGVYKARERIHRSMLTCDY